MFLLTNDDGIDAPGLAAMQRAIEPLGSAIVLAPDRHLSGCSHQATTGRGLELREVGEHRYWLDGSPVDCARVGFRHLAPASQWLLSGINEGGNLGADIYLSGTVAAAREACLLGQSAIAISQYFPRRPINWEQSSLWARHVIQLLMAHERESRTFWNVNLPPTGEGNAMPECVYCPVDPNPLPAEYELRDGLLHYRARYQQRQRTAGHDVELCFGGKITISKLFV